MTEIEFPIVFLRIAYASNTLTVFLSKLATLPEEEYSSFLWHINWSSMFFVTTPGWMHVPGSRSLPYSPFIEDILNKDFPLSSKMAKEDCLLDNLIPQSL